MGGKRSGTDESGLVPANRTTAPTPRQVRDAVQRILRSKPFVSARRARELLQYLVEQVLAGRAAAIKEYSIAADVFGRDPSFDPRIDTTVRTEAWRLRRRLRNYYQDEGHDEEVRVDFPARMLAPSFVVVRPSIAQPEPPPVQWILIERPKWPARSDNDQFSAAVVDEAVCALHRWPGVRTRVVEPNTGTGDVRLRCSVRGTGNHRRVIVTLSDEHGRDVRAAEVYSCTATEDPLRALSVAESVVKMIAENLAGSDAPLSIDLLNEVDRTRYLDSMLRGSGADRSRRLAELRHAIQRLQRIIRNDPHDATAHRRLMAAFGLFLSMVPTATPHLFEKINDVARRALELDPELSDVCMTLGMACTYAYDWKNAEAAYRRAAAIDPLDPTAHVFLALNHVKTGHITAAFEAAQTASRLDPHSAVVASCYGIALCHERRFRDAANVARRAIDIDPDFARVRLLLGECHLHADNVKDAVDEFELAHQCAPDDPAVLGRLGLAYARGGNRDRARQLIEQLESGGSLRAETPSATALIHLGLGECDKALHSLAQAVRTLGTPALFLGSADFDPLRSDSRFTALLRTMSISAG